MRALGMTSVVVASALLAASPTRPTGASMMVRH
jgi:hypothetical protein